MLSVNVWTQKLVFVLGKGGTGKTLFSKLLARILAAQGKRVLICHILQTNESEQKLIKPDSKKYPSLFEFTLNSTTCFEEYVRLKIPIRKIADLLLHNRIVQYLEKAAPGVREMVLMGKLWHDASDFDHVVIDMPSTGYALTMIHTPFNFSNLFPGGPIYQDSQKMIEFYRNPEKSKFILIALPEEMPIQESIECRDEIAKLIPKNPPQLVINRILHLHADARNYFEKASELSVDESVLWLALKHQYFKMQKQIRQLEQLKFNWKDSWIELPDVASMNEPQIISTLSDEIYEKSKFN